LCGINLESFNRPKKAKARQPIGPNANERTSGVANHHSGVTAGDVVNEQLLGLKSVRVSHKILDVNISRVTLGENYRKSFKKSDLEELAESIRHVGLCKPVWVEKKDDKWEVFVGQRRYLASIIVGKTIRIREFSNLTPRQRIFLQMSENIQEPTPSYDMAEFYWEIYKIELSEKTGMNLRALDRYESYWNIEDEIRRTYPLSRFSYNYRRDESMMADAFRFQRLHGMLKHAIHRGSISYSVGTQIARIASKDQQWSLFRGMEKKRKGRLTEGYVRYRVNELLSCQQKENEVLELKSVERRNDNGRLEALCTAMDRSTKILEGFARVHSLGSIETDETLSSVALVISELDRDISDLERRICESTDYLDRIRNRTHRHRESLKARILANKVKLDSVQNETESAHIITSNNVVRIKITKIYRDKKQIRRTFNQRSINILAENMRHAGQLEPIGVRPYRSGYKLIDGERRYRAAKLIGLKCMNAVVINADVKTCRRIQAEANLQSPVPPEERAQALAHIFDQERALMKMDGKKLTEGQFLKTVPEFSSTTVKKALLHYNLNEKIKDLVGYSVGVELAGIVDPRLQLNLAIAAAVNNYSVNKVRAIAKEVNSYPKEEYSPEVRNFWNDIDKNKNDSTLRHASQDLLTAVISLRDSIKPVIASRDAGVNGKELFSNERMVEKFDALVKTLASVRVLLPELKRAKHKLKLGIGTLM